MNDNSVNVYAQAKMKFSDLTTFSICTWVKFTYEVIYYCPCLLFSTIPKSLQNFYREYTINYGPIALKWKPVMEKKILCVAVYVSYNFL